MFIKIVSRVGLVLDVAGRVVASVMLLLLLGNIIGAQFGVPIYGTVEIAAFCTAGVIALGLTRCGLDGGHIAVTFVVDKFPFIPRKVISSIMSLVCIVITALIAWQSFVYAANMAAKGETTGSLYMPIYPIIYIIAVSFVGLALAYVVELIKHLSAGKHETAASTHFGEDLASEVQPGDPDNPVL